MLGGATGGSRTCLEQQCVFKATDPTTPLFLIHLPNAQSEFIKFNDILKLELAEHIEARKMVMKRAFESVRNGMGCFFSGASRCVSKFNDAFGDLPVEGKALSVEAVGIVEDVIFEENLLVSIAVALAESGMESKENIRLSAGSDASAGMGIDVSKKKWAEMRGDFMTGGSNLSKNIIRRSSKKSSGKKKEKSKNRGDSPRKGSAFGNFFVDENQANATANGFFKVFNFFGNNKGSADPNISAISSIEENALSSPSSLGSIGNRSVGDVEAERELKKRIHALTTGENLDNSSTPSGYVTNGALTKRLSESSLLSEVSYLSSDTETDNLLKRTSSDSTTASKNSSVIVANLLAGSRKKGRDADALDFEDNLGNATEVDFILRASLKFLDVLDLTNCRAVSKKFHSTLTKDRSIWQRCVRRGGVAAHIRGDFWLWILYGSMGFVQPRKGGVGDYRKLKASRKYWTLLKEATSTFEMLNEQRTEAGEAPGSPTKGDEEGKGGAAPTTPVKGKGGKANAPSPSPMRRNMLKSREGRWEKLWAPS